MVLPCTLMCIRELWRLHLAGGHHARAAGHRPGGIRTPGSGRADSKGAHPEQLSPKAGLMGLQQCPRVMSPFLFRAYAICEDAFVRRKNIDLLKL